MKTYLIGSLRNPKIPQIGNRLREIGHDVFDDWFAAGPEADDYWKRYEQERGRSYEEAIVGFAARNVFWFDLEHLNKAECAVLVAPAGQSAHLEFGFCLGRDKLGYVCFPEGDPERWDVMYQFANKVFFSVDALVEYMSQCS